MITLFKKLFASVIDIGLQTPVSVFPHPFTSTETRHLSWLLKVSPCFPISSKNITILSEPVEFYNCLFEHCKNVSQRVTLASLYIGNGELEKNLVNALVQNHNLSQLTVNLLLDYSRGSRCINNSRVILQPLLKQSKNCTLSLYHTPKLRGILKKVMPNRWNELVGVQHMKLYIFDNTLVISGANLSNDYFTNRQDRYYVIEDKNLCDFYAGLVQHVQHFSIKVDKDNKETTGKFGAPYEGSKNDFIQNAGHIIERYLHDAMVENNNHFQIGHDTWVFPLIQMGQLGIKQDVMITQRLFSEAKAGTTLNIATAYFNLTNSYVDSLIKDCQADCNLLMAHPEANGFLNATGMAGGIPSGYTLLGRRFECKLRRFMQDNRIHLFEYLRRGWTYHAKGMWYYAPRASTPCLTLIGSPNFGDRSVLKDLETQVAIVTENPSLQKALHNECTFLYKQGLPADFKRDVPAWVYVMVFCFKDFF